MTVVTLAQARLLAPVAFGLTAPPMQCDGCGVDWNGTAPIKTPYGAFRLWCCFPCNQALARQWPPQAGDGCPVA